MDARIGTSSLPLKSCSLMPSCSAVGLAAAGRIDGMARAVPDAPPGSAARPGDGPEGLREVVRLPVVHPRLPHGGCG